MGDGRRRVGIIPIRGTELKASDTPDQVCRARLPQSVALAEIGCQTVQATVSQKSIRQKPGQTP
jgi:hypothetical protein